MRRGTFSGAFEIRSRQKGERSGGNDAETRLEDLQLISGAPIHRCCKNLFELDQPVVADRVHTVGGRTREGNRSGSKRCNRDCVASVRRCGQRRSGERCGDEQVASPAGAAVSGATAMTLLVSAGAAAGAASTAWFLFAGPAGRALDGFGAAVVVSMTVGVSRLHMATYSVATASVATASWNAIISPPPAMRAPECDATGNRRSRVYEIGRIDDGRWLMGLRLSLREPIKSTGSAGAGSSPGCGSTPRCGFAGSSGPPRRARLQVCPLVCARTR
jgi:hypothetical protein